MSLGEELQKARKARRLTASEVAAGTRMKVQIVDAIEQEDFGKIAAPIYAKGFIKLYAEYVGLDPKPLIDEYISRYVSPPPEPIFDNELDYEEPEEDTRGRKFMFPRRRVDDESPSGGDVEPGAVSPARSSDLPGRGNEEHYDLFSGVDVRGGEDFHPGREPEPMLGEFGRQLMPGRALDGFVGLGRAILDGAAMAAGRVRSAVMALEFGSPLRIASAVAILLIIIIFLVSTLSRCAGPSESDEAQPALAVEENLNIAVDPPDTYLD